MGKERLAGLNYFYIYGFMWSAILILYSFGWSNLCLSMNPQLILFFIVTILISLILGKIFEKNFRFSLLDKIPSHCGRFTKYIVLITVVELIYSREIPLLSIIIGKSGYGESAGGIPVLHSLLVSFGFFYLQYLFYCFLSDTRKKRLLVYYTIVLVCIYLIWFSRMGIMMSLLLSGIMWFKAKSHLFNIKRLIISLVLLLFIFYLFGVLGNIRSGYGPFDCTLIRVFGDFNNKYPSWMPDEYMWAYSYIIGPVATFNYNVNNYHVSYDLIGLISTFMPDFLEKRLFSSYLESRLLSGSTLIKVIVGMGEPYEYFGMIGVYLFYFYTMFVPLICLKLCRIQKKFYIPMQAIFIAIIIFMFYVNTWWYSGISFALIFPILLKRKIILGGKELIQ